MPNRLAQHLLFHEGVYESACISPITVLPHGPRDSKFYAISIPPIDEIFDSPNVPLYRYECFELAIDAINSHESITHAIGY